MYKKVLKNIGDIEEFAANTYNMPAFNILWGGKATEQEDNGFIDTGSKDMDQFYNNAHKLSSYYMSAERNTAELSLKILGMINNQEENVLDGFIKAIKDGNLSVEEAVEKFKKEKGYEGGKPLLGKNSPLSKNIRSLLRVLAKVERVNILVKEEYNRTANGQNPLRRALVDANLEAGIEDSGTVKGVLKRLLMSKEALALHKELTEDKKTLDSFTSELSLDLEGNPISFEDLGVIVSQLEKGEEIGDIIKNNGLGEAWRSVSNHNLFAKNGENTTTVKNIVAKNKELFDLSSDHSSVLRASMTISTETFKKKNSAQLSSLLFEGGRMKTNGVRGTSIAKISQEIKNAIEVLPEADKNRYGLQDEVGKDEFTLNIMSNFMIMDEDSEQKKKEKKDFFELLVQQDETMFSVERDSEGNVKKGVPPNSRNEQIFSKVLEDLIYNELIKKTKASEIFAKINTGEEDSTLDDGIIGVVDNLKNERYSFVDTDRGLKDKVHTEAMGLKNLDTLIEKISRGELNSEEIRDIIETKIPFLSEEDKRVLKDNIESMNLEEELLSNRPETELDKRDQERDSDKIRSHRSREITPELLAKNYTAGHHGWGLYGTIYGDDKYTLQVGKRVLMSKNKAEFFVCLEKASSPEVTSQTQAGVTDGCMKDFRAKMERGREGYEKALNTVYAGIVPFMAFFIMFRTAQFEAIENRVLTAMLDSGLDEDLMQNYVFSGENDIEKEFRLKALYVDKHLVDEGCIDRLQEKDYMYQMSIATDEIIKTNSNVLNAEDLARVASATTEEDVVSAVAVARENNLENFGFTGSGLISYDGLKERTGKFRITLADDIKDFQKEVEGERKKEAAEAHTKILSALKKIDEELKKGGSITEVVNKTNAKAGLIGALAETIKYGYEKGDFSIEDLLSSKGSRIPSLEMTRTAIESERNQAVETLAISHEEIKKKQKTLDGQLSALDKKKSSGTFTKEDLVKRNMIEDAIKSTVLKAKNLHQDKKDIETVLVKALDILEGMEVSVKKESAELREMVEERKRADKERFKGDIAELKKEKENMGSSGFFGGSSEAKILKIDEKIKLLKEQVRLCDLPATAEEIEVARTFVFRESVEEGIIRTQSRTPHRDENLYGELEILDKYMDKIKDLKEKGGITFSEASNIIERVMAQKVIVMEGYLKKEAIVSGKSIKEEKRDLFLRDKDRFLNSGNCEFFTVEQEDKSQIQIITTNKRAISNGMIEFNNHLMEYLKTGSGKAQIWLAKRGLVASRERSSVSPKAKPAIEKSVLYDKSTNVGRRTRDVANAAINVIIGKEEETNSFFKKNAKKG